MASPWFVGLSVMVGLALTTASLVWAGAPLLGGLSVGAPIVLWVAFFIGARVDLWPTDSMARPKWRVWTLRAMLLVTLVPHVALGALAEARWVDGVRTYVANNHGDLTELSAAEYYALHGGLCISLWFLVWHTLLSYRRILRNRSS